MNPNPIEETLKESQERAARFEREAIELEEQSVSLQRQAKERRLLMSAEESRIKILSRALRADAPEPMMEG